MNEHHCLLCGGPAAQRKLPDRNRYEYDCTACGIEYATGRLGILLRRNMLQRNRATHVSFIQRENRAGRRPFI